MFGKICKEIVLTLVFLCLMMVTVQYFVDNDEETAPEELFNDDIAMRDRNAELPTLFDKNQQRVRDDARSDLFTNPNAYEDRPLRR